jgi:aspartate/methionine/tyrosine aminotransferase
VSYDPQAHILGREVVWLPCSIDEAWKLSPDVLQHHCEKRQGKPCLLVLNYPSNPTGQSFTEEELIALANVARAHNLLVLSDEICEYLVCICLL